MIFIERDIQSIDQNRKSSLPNDLAVEGEVILKLNNYFSRYVHHYVSQNPVYLSLSLSKNSLFSLRIPAFRASPNFQTEVDSSKNGTRLGLSFSSRSVRPVKMYVYVRRRERERERESKREKQRAWSAGSVKLQLNRRASLPRDVGVPWGGRAAR